MIWDYLDLVRTYTKPRGLAPDYNEPVILPAGKTTVEDFCNRIHKVGRRGPRGGRGRRVGRR